MCWMKIVTLKKKPPTIFIGIATFNLKTANGQGADKGQSTNTDQDKNHPNSAAISLGRIL